jgi:hypothetical protein
MWMRRISLRIPELLVEGESGAMRRERWGGVLAAVVRHMGRKAWASWDLHLPPFFPLCLAVVVPGGGGERHRRRPDRPHPLLYSPVRRCQFSFSPLRLFLLICYLVDVVPRMQKPP